MRVLIVGADRFLPTTESTDSSAYGFGLEVRAQSTAESLYAEVDNAAALSTLEAKKDWFRVKNSPTLFGIAGATMKKAEIPIFTARTEEIMILVRHVGEHALH